MAPSFLVVYPVAAGGTQNWAVGWCYAFAPGVYVLNGELAFVDYPSM